MLPRNGRRMAWTAGGIHLRPRERPFAGAEKEEERYSVLMRRMHTFNSLTRRIPPSPRPPRHHRMSSSGTSLDLSKMIKDFQESTTLQQRKDEQIDLLQKIQVVNEIRKEDMRRRKAWCRTTLRMPQSTHYDSFTDAMEAAQRYARQSNQATLQEAQHWQPYSEPQVLAFFEHLSSTHVLEEKQLHSLLDSYLQLLDSTAIFVLRKTYRGKRKSFNQQPAVTNYPRSSLTLLTQLKGLHNATRAATEPALPTSLIQFLLHRTDTDDPDAATTRTDPPFHQSPEDYDRMMTAWELARARMLWEAKRPDKRPGDPPSAADRSPKTAPLASHLAYHLPVDMFRQCIDFVTEWVRSRTPQMRRIHSVVKIPFGDVLGPLYYPVVMRQVADYLLSAEVVDAPVAPDHSNAAALYPYYTPPMVVVESQRFYRSAVKKRSALQEKWLQVAMGVQQALWHGSPIIVLGEEETPPNMLTHISQGVTAAGPLDDHPVPGPTAEEEVAATPEEEEEVPISAIGAMRQRRKMEADLIENLDESEIRPVAIRKQKTAAQVSMKRVHAVFEAISLQPPGADAVAMAPPPETTTPLVPAASEPCSAPESLVAPVNGAAWNDASQSAAAHPGPPMMASVAPSSGSRMVFIDNLPIDIHDDRIWEVFSRCGDIEAVTIYNRRPDLDPGPLPQAELAQRRSRQNKMTLSESKWQRPKTPVYGLITFATDEGARKALDDSLRIFGMILQRHPVRSIPSWKMNKLFIEDIPEGQPSIELEYQLSHVLEPDIFVCLDAGQDVKSAVHSCEISFPSFAVAYASYIQLQEKLSILAPRVVDHQATTGEPPLPPCRINWMRTEKDAVQWWSRNYGFD
jgi:hypothetical protein